MTDEHGYNIEVDLDGEVLDADLMEAFLDELAKHSLGPVVSAGPDGVGMRFSLEYGGPRSLEDVGQDGADIVRKVLAELALHDLAVEFLGVETDAHLQRELNTPNFPELVGLSEIAEILGVSKQRVGQLRERDDFPRPVAELRSGPVWSRPMLDRFIDEWPRRSGHPRAWDPEQINDEIIEEVRSKLSDRELVILHRLADGATQSELMDELGISAEALRSATRRILEKLRVHSRLEAVATVVGGRRAKDRAAS